jgi:hypothetical protein
VAAKLSSIVELFITDLTLVTLLVGSVHIQIEQTPFFEFRAHSQTHTFFFLNTDRGELSFEQFDNLLKLGELGKYFFFNGKRVEHNEINSISK